METIKVKITQSFAWYKKGEVHEVNNYVCFNWGKGGPHFEESKELFGIYCKHCEILPLDEQTREYTMEQLFEKIGHEFKIIGA